MTNYNKFENNLNRKVELLNEAVGRGRGLQGFKGISDNLASLSKTISYDYLNRPTHKLFGRLEKYNFNNFYTLDIRSKSDKISTAFLDRKQDYVDIFEKDIYVREGIEENMKTQLQRMYGGIVADYQGKDILKQELKDRFPNDGPQQIDLSRLINQQRDDQGSRERLAASYDHSFDDLCGVLLMEVSAEDIELTNAIIQHNNIAVGSTLTYNSPGGRTHNVEVVSLPKELGGKAGPGNVIVQIVGSIAPPTAVPIVNNGNVMMSDVEIPPNDAGSVEVGERDYENPNHKIWGDDVKLDKILSTIPILKKVYDDMPVVSFLSDTGGIAIKKDINGEGGFVSLMMDGLVSAIKGNVPQGVTIEELMVGKFSRKAIAPEQGTFINRVKDPTSDKPFDFRSDNPKILLNLHNMIIETFKNKSLNRVVPELQEIVALPMIQKNMVLYMTQDDFNQLEKGGEGFRKLAKKTIDYISRASPDVDF